MITAVESCRRGWRSRSDASRFHKPAVTYLNNRHYDPTVGVFASVDPLVTKTGQPYVYGAANPVRFSDPSGLEPRPIHEGINRRRVGGACSGPCLEALLPDRHRHLLDQEFPTDPAADPTGQIRVGGIIPVGPADSRLAEAWACDWDPGQCRSVERAAAIVNSLLPDSGDGSQNNAERHALLSAVYFILEFDTGGPDAHENLFGSQLAGYLNDLRLMDLVNNEVGFDIARDYILSPDAAPIDFFGSKLPLVGRSIDSQVPLELLGLVREASDDRRLVWLP